MRQSTGVLDKKIALRLKNDGVYFSEKILGVKLHYYQQEVMNENHRWIAMCWSRQLGKTTLLAIKATHFACTFQATADKKENLIMVLSQDRERAREFYNLILSFITASPLLSNMIVGEAKQSETKLSNGTRIINKAAGRDGRSLRGYSVDLLIIDEADFIPEPVFVAGEQCTASTRGKIWLISTPFKKSTTFYKYFTDGQLSKQKFKDPSLLDKNEDPYDSPIGRKYGYLTYWHDYNSGLKAMKSNGDTQIDEDFVRKKQISMAKWHFQQEYLAQWSDDIASYFNEQQIMNIVDRDFDPLTDYVYERIHPSDTLYVGIDFAKHKDRTVLVCIKKQINGEYRVQFTYEMEGRDWNKQLIKINEMMFWLKPTEIWVDKTGIGDVMYDLMTLSDVMPNGDTNHMLGYIDEVTMTIQKKNGLYSHLQNMIGNRMITIPNHERFIKELVFLQYEKTLQSEWVRILAPESGEEDLHDDYPDALALAIHATRHDALFIPTSMQGIRKAMVTTVAKKAVKFDPDDDLDNWERNQIEMGAKIYDMGTGKQRGKQAGRRQYQRSNLRRR